jgi:hypothetical protein
VVLLRRGILARRYEESLFSSRVLSVGKHYLLSKGSLAYSPLTTYDIQLLASIRKNNSETSFVTYSIDMQL